MTAGMRCVSIKTWKVEKILNVVSFAVAFELKLLWSLLFSGWDSLAGYGRSPAERLLGQTLGIPREDPGTAKLLLLPSNATFSSGFEIACVSCKKGAYLCMSQDCCVEVQGGVSSGHNRYLLVAPLQKETKSTMIFPKWNHSSGQLALLPVERLKGQEPYRLIRKDATGIWLLR